MDAANVDQGDSCHGHRKILCQPARTLSHTWTVNAVGPWGQCSRVTGSLCRILILFSQGHLFFLTDQCRKWIFLIDEYCLYKFDAVCRSIRFSEYLFALYPISTITHCSVLDSDPSAYIIFSIPVVCSNWKPRWFPDTTQRPRRCSQEQVLRHTGVDRTKTMKYNCWSWSKHIQCIWWRGE